MDDKEIVAAVLANLAERLGSDRFEVWFGANVRLALGQSTLEVQVPNQFHQNWLRQNFRGDLEAACQAVVARPLALEFRIVEALAAKTSAASRNPADRQRQLAFGDDEALTDSDYQRTGADSSSVGAALLEAPARRSKQRAFASPPLSSGRKYASLASFVVGSTNRLAHASAAMVAERPGAVNPLFVHGPTGVGKTHLLEGVLSEARRRQRNFNAIYLTAEQFTTGFLEALRGSGLPNFRQKYRGVDLLILDDLQFFAGKRATVIEFLHTLDTLVQQGRQLVVAADRPPASLNDLGRELTTRLAAGMVAKIEPADHATRLGIVRDKAAQLGLELADDVRDLLATHLTTHARELTGALHRLLAMSRISPGPITRASAEEALAEMLHDHARPVQLTEIDQAVCEVFGLSQSSLQASRRAKALNAPRMLAMWLARKHTRAALSEIGAYFGRRSHSTVISAHKTVSRWVTQQADMHLADKQCQVEDAIRRVEAKLRAG